MKKILLVIIGLLVMLSIASTDTPQNISGYEVLEVRKIYKVSAQVSNPDDPDACSTTYYWWVDEWGRPVDEMNYEPAEVLPYLKMLEEYLNKIFPPAEEEDNFAPAVVGDIKA